MRDTQINDDGHTWYDEADIDLVHRLLANAGVESIWVKYLSKNHNSKQQVWLAGDPSDLSFLPAIRSTLLGIFVIIMT